MLGSNAEQYTDINNSEYLFNGIAEEPSKVWNKQDAKITNLNSININTDLGLKYNYFVSEKSSINLKVFYQLYPMSFSNDFDFNFSYIYSSTRVISATGTKFTNTLYVPLKSADFDSIFSNPFSAYIRANFFA